MKVLLYSPVSLSYRGGVELYFEHLAHVLTKQFGDEVRIVCGDLHRASRGSTPISHSWEQKRGVEPLVAYKEIHLYRLWHVLIPPLSSLKTLYREFRWADVVYFSYGFFGQDFLILLLKLIARKRVISGVHAPLFHGDIVHNLSMALLGRLTLPRFDGVHLLAKTYRALLTKWGARAIAVIPCGIDASRFARRRVKKASRFTVLFVGRLEYQKGIDVLLEVASTLPSVSFIIAGDGSYRKAVEALAVSHWQVDYKGSVSYHNLPSLYSRADLLLFPSREETSPAVLFEALACGLPVLASHIPPCREILGILGLYIKDFSAASWVHEVNRCQKLKATDVKWWEKRSLDLHDRARKYEFTRLVNVLRTKLLQPRPSRGTLSA